MRSLKVLIHVYVLVAFLGTWIMPGWPLYIEDGMLSIGIAPKTERVEAMPTTRSKTVEFFAGQLSSATAVNDRTQQTFAQQTVELAESGVNVVDAYVEFWAEIGGVTATTYAEALIAFDACLETCTAAAWSGTGAVTMHTAGLGTNSAEAQTVRLRAPVTLEATIDAYTGAGADFEFQVGYCFDTTDNGACDTTGPAASIQTANAKLIITYTYTATSDTLTNTVYYPLARFSGAGSATSTQASCTMDSNCPTFQYNAEIPEISTQLSQFFQIQTSLDTNGTTDWQTISDITSNGTNGSTLYFESALTNNGGWVQVLQSGLTGYANNSADSIEISTNASNAYVLGGENVVTYTYASTSATKTKTVTFPVGELVTAASSTAKSAMTGSTVYFPETGVDVKSAWFRVHTSAGGFTIPGILDIVAKVGSNADLATTTYRIASDTQGVSDDGYFVHVIPSSEYATIEAADWDTGVTVQMAAQWGAVARGAVSAELVITYTYTSDTDGYLSTQKLFAAQATTTAATTYRADFNAINPSFPETVGTTTIRGVSHLMNGKNTGTTANEAMGSNLTTSTCSASNTSTATTDSEITTITMYKAVSGIVTNQESGTYTACYSSAQSSVFTGVVTITHQWDDRTYEQSAYRLFSNADSTDIGMPLALQDTGATLASPGSAFRLRMLLHVHNEQLSTSGENFKLQFATRSGTCDAAFSGETYADVTGASAIAYNNNATPADGDNLTASSTDPTHSGHTIVNQDYEEANNFTNTVAAIGAGQDGKWDFALIDNGGTAEEYYCFRIVKSDGTTLKTYTVVPEVRMAPANALPTASAVSIDSAAASVTLTEGTTKNVACAGTVTDTNGYTDITAVGAFLFRTSIGTTTAPDDNNQYRLYGDSQCVPSGGSGNSETYTCTFAVQYFADPTDASSPNSSDNWTCEMWPRDGVATGTVAVDTIEMASLIALDVTASIAYGSVNANSDTGALNQTTTITNTGNRDIDPELSGVAMTDGGTGSIPATQQKYADSAFTYSGGGTALTTSPTAFNLTLPQRTSTEITDDILWGLGVPNGTPNGSYSGTNTFTAAAGI